MSALRGRPRQLMSVKQVRKYIPLFKSGAEVTDQGSYPQFDIFVEHKKIVVRHNAVGVTHTV